MISLSWEQICTGQLFLRQRHCVTRNAGPDAEQKGPWRFALVGEGAEQPQAYDPEQAGEEAEKPQAPFAQAVAYFIGHRKSGEGASLHVMVQGRDLRYHKRPWRKWLFIL